MEGSTAVATAEITGGTFNNVFKAIFSGKGGATASGWEEIVIAVAFSVAVVILGIILAKILRSVFRHIAKRLAKLTKTNLDEMLVESLAQPVHNAAILSAVYLAWSLYPFDKLGLESLVSGALFVFAVLIAIKGILGLLMAFFNWYSTKAESETGVTMGLDFIPLIRKVVSVAIYSVALIIVLEHFGVDIVALVTTLGVASMAVAFAAQDTLANMISGFVLMTDRPFRVGDRVKVAGVYGDVTRIGMRSTDILTLNNTTVVVPNSTIAGEYVENFNYPDTVHKLKLNIGLAYGTDPEAAIKTMLTAVRGAKGVLKDPAPSAFFMEFGDFSLNFLIVAWCRSFTEGLDVTNAINVKLNRTLTDGGYDIPFPIQTLQLKNLE
ncbi:mechanosensitive ion channel [bacterium]|nr:mechanosensitive ion channel [bacterium]